MAVTIDNAHEHTTTVEYCLRDCAGEAHRTRIADGPGHFCARHVHRSVHVTLKEWPDGMGTALGSLAVNFTGGVDRWRIPKRSDSQAKVDLMNRLHAFGASVVRAGTTKDDYKAALYLVSATRNATDTVYNSTGEVSGTNYTAGGVAVTTANAPALDGKTAIFTPSASIVFTTVTLATAFDAMLLYNETSAARLAVAVFTFGSQTVTAGTFTLTMPVSAAATALVRIA